MPLLNDRKIVSRKTFQKYPYQIHFYLFCLQDVGSRVQILKAQTSKFSLGEDVSLTEIAEQLPETVTGAKLFCLFIICWSFFKVEIIDYLFKIFTLVAFVFCNSATDKIC